MEGSRSLFNGAGAMRIERGAQRLLFLRKETLTGRVQPPAMRGPFRIPAKPRGHFLGLEPNISSQHAAGETTSRE
jgi:hypothetical protein